MAKRVKRHQKSIKNHYVYSVPRDGIRGGVNPLIKCVVYGDFWMHFPGGVETLIKRVVYYVFWRHFRGGVKTLIKPVVFGVFWGAFSPWRALTRSSVSF